MGQTTGAQEAKVRAFRRHPPGTREPESSTLPGEEVVEDAQGQHRIGAAHRRSKYTRSVSLPGG